MPEASAVVARIKITCWRVYHERDPRYSRFPLGRELIERREVACRSARRAFLPNDTLNWIKVQFAKGYQVVMEPVLVDPEVVATMPISKRAQIDD